MKSFFSHFRTSSSTASNSQLPPYYEATAATEVTAVVPPPPTYSRLSELYISTVPTIRTIDLAFRTHISKDTPPTFYLVISKTPGKNGFLEMQLCEGKDRKAECVGVVTREGRGDFLFEVGRNRKAVGANGPGELRMEMRMQGIWSFAVPISECTASEPAGPAATPIPSSSETPPSSTAASTAATAATAKTTFAWRIHTQPPTSSSARTQKTLSAPDLSLVDYGTGEVHAAYVTDVGTQLAGRVEGRLQFRRSFGQAWEWLVLLSLAALLEKERARRAARGTFTAGEMAGQAG